MKYRAYRLHFRGALHIGSNRPGFEHTEDIIHSDTLFSAILNAWSQMDPDFVTTLIPPEKDSITEFPFRISSAFPFYGNQFFFPKPYAKIWQEDPDNSPTTAKAQKKVRFIEKTILESVLNGILLKYHSEANQSVAAYYSPDSPLDSPPGKAYDVPRLKIDRNNQGQTIFYFTRIVFQPDSGLFFLVDCEDETLLHKFEAALRLLGDMGIGGDRSVGHGLFTPESVTDFELKTPDNPTHRYVLSLTHPASDDDVNLLKNSGYDLIERKGWAWSGRGISLRRKAVRMLMEGSVLQQPGFKGDIIKVLDTIETDWALEHPLYRNGLGFGIPYIQGDKL